MGEKKEIRERRVEELANYFFAVASAVSPEERLKVLQKAFTVAADKEDDEMTNRLMDAVRQVYKDEEEAVAFKTDMDYGKAGLRAYTRYCDYLRIIYPQLPFVGAGLGGLRETPIPQTKSKITQLWMRQWQRYACDFTDKDGEAVDAFSFLLFIYTGVVYEGAKPSCYVSREEKENILKLFRDYTDYRFTPEIAEKWLKQPNVPEEIRKIFIIARARNGGTKLVERDMKNAEMLKPLDVEKRSEAALAFHKKFCEELAIIDDRVKQFIKELGTGPCPKAEKINIDEIRFSSRESVYEVILSIYYKKNYLPYSSASGMAADIHRFFKKYNRGHYIRITYILREEEIEHIHGSDIVYFSS